MYCTFENPQTHSLFRFNVMKRKKKLNLKLQSERTGENEITREIISANMYRQKLIKDKKKSRSVGKRKVPRFCDRFCTKKIVINTYFKDKREIILHFNSSCISRIHRKKNNDKIRHTTCSFLSTHRIKRFSI